MEYAFHLAGLLFYTVGTVYYSIALVRLLKQSKQ